MTNIAIYGAGTTFGTPALLDVSTLFSSLSAYTSVPQYTTIVGDPAYEQTAVSSVLANDQDFAITINIPDKSGNAALKTMPLLGGAVVCIYNVEGMCKKRCKNGNTSYRC